MYFVTSGSSVIEITGKEYKTRGKSDSNSAKLGQHLLGEIRHIFTIK
jgi:hypothetical protein